MYVAQRSCYCNILHTFNLQAIFIVLRRLRYGNEIKKNMEKEEGAAEKRFVSTAESGDSFRYHVHNQNLWTVKFFGSGIGDGNSSSGSGG